MPPCNSLENTNWKARAEKKKTLVKNLDEREKSQVGKKKVRKIETIFPIRVSQGFSSNSYAEDIYTFIYVLTSAILVELYLICCANLRCSLGTLDFRLLFTFIPQIIRTKTYFLVSLDRSLLFDICLGGVVNSPGKQKGVNSIPADARRNLQLENL